MRYMYKRGKGAMRRVLHLTGFDSVTGEPSMLPLCHSKLLFNTTSNVPFGRPVCKLCRVAAGSSHTGGNK